jgi:RimJ/RimL family protein N-acetyltransferase
MAVKAPKSLVGEKIYLRPTTPEDYSSIYMWQLANDPQSTTSHPRIMKTAAQAIEAFKSAQPKETEQTFTVIRKKDDGPVGMIRFFGLNNLNRSAELGLLIDPDEQRNGFGTEAMQVLIRFLFRYRALNKVHAQTADFNEGAVALLDKLGFKRDARLRQHYFYDGTFHDGYIYSLLLHELDF